MDYSSAASGLMKALNGSQYFVDHCSPEGSSEVADVNEVLSNITTLHYCRGKLLTCPLT